MKAITVAKLVLGGLLGGGIVYALTSPASPPQRGGSESAASAREAPEARAPGDGLAPRSDASGTSAASRLDALASSARVTPERAFAEAMATKPTRLRELALARVAREWAAVDADRALAALERISDRMSRRAFGGALFATLARIDADAAMNRLLEANIDDAVLALDAIGELAEQNPDAMKALIERTTDRAMRDFLQNRLVGAVAGSDPLGAVELAASFPEANMRQLYYETGRRYAAGDPEGAVTWALSVADGAGALLSTIMSQVAGDDLLRAVDIALRRRDAPIELESMFNIARSSTGQSIVSSNVIENVDQLPEVADRLLGSDHPRAQAAMDRLFESWAVVDPDAALSWVIARGATVDTRHFASLAAGYSQGDLRLAADMADRLTPAARGAWIAEVAAAYMHRDPDAALEWLARYRTSPDYDAWVSAAAQRALRNMPMSTDPSAAIRLLTSTTKPEPAAAVDVVSRWMQTDARGAIDWTLGLASGAARDSALSAIVPRQILEGSVDARVLAGFSDAASREDALRRALPMLSQLARGDPARARAVANAHYTTPELRQAAQVAIDGTVRNPR